MELPPAVAATGPLHVPLPPQAIPVGVAPTDADIVRYQAYVTNLKAIYAAYPGAIDIAAISHWEAYVTSLHVRQNHAVAMEGLLAPVLAILQEMQQQQGQVQQQLLGMIQRQDAIQTSVNKLLHRDSNKDFFAVNKATRDRGTGQLNFCYNADGALPEAFPVNMHEFGAMNAATTTGFLAFYGLDQSGSLDIKKRRLLEHLCA